MTGREGLAILVVSESLFIRHYFFHIFERNKNNLIRLAASGREAVEAMGCPPATGDGFFRPFDLVFINDYLPDMGAAELLERIAREHPGAKRFVLLTHVNDAKRLIGRHGATGVIMKPFTSGDILKRVKEALPERNIRIAEDITTCF